MIELKSGKVKKPFLILSLCMCFVFFDIIFRNDPLIEIIQHKRVIYNWFITTSLSLNRKVFCYYPNEEFFFNAHESVDQLNNIY